MLARRIYWALLVISILMGIYFYWITPEQYSPQFLIPIAFVQFLLLIAGVHGLLAHTLKAQTKYKLISYPLVLGIIYVILFFIHLFVVMPLIRL
ncbi:hypothetical protein [Algoriphagus sp. CAU 1675]|uniref:hypothetical protein n=1 Tax=Algoriphagus sp. CAU 1675 TaxID=3032597 RepID=UPI0023DC4C64|nr:hypothetical protein [Algoriphagus sp. CAU 1675]MDF2158046.1 hypothetical protein [Algoriphagus sp. CAU 1675]